MELSQLIGLTAPILFLYPYAMVSLGRWQSESLKFHVCNFLGASAILVSLIDAWNLPVFILEICWGLISLLGIARALRLRRSA